MAELIRLLYVSQAVKPISPAELAALLQKSQQNNNARGLTGLLLSAGDHFMQVLEGTSDAVTERLTVIAADPRHCNVRRVLCEATTERLFGKWTMASLAADRTTPLDRQQLRQLIERPADATVATNRTQVHKLLQNFRDQLSNAAAKAA